MSRPTTALLTLSGIALVAILVTEIRGTQPHLDSRGADPSLGAATTQFESTPGPETSFTVPPIRSLSAFVTRPLFSENRRPPPPATELPTPDNQPTIDRSHLLLKAVVISGEERYVLLRDQASGKVSTLRSGETIAGWSIGEIRADAVVLSGHGQTIELRLRLFERRSPSTRRSS